MNNQTKQRNKKITRLDCVGLSDGQGGVTMEGDMVIRKKKKEQKEREKKKRKRESKGKKENNKKRRQGKE